MLTRVLGDGVLSVTLQDGGQKPSESSEPVPAADTGGQSEIRKLQHDAAESWTRFVYGAREMKTGARHLLRILRRWMAWVLARCTAHCIQFLTTTLPNRASHLWHETTALILKRHKSVTTWAAVTLTEKTRPAPTLTREATSIGPRELHANDGRAG